MKNELKWSSALRVTDLNCKKLKLALKIDKMSDFDRVALLMDDMTIFRELATFATSNVYCLRTTSNVSWRKIRIAHG